MGAELVQRRVLLRRSYSLGDDGIRVTERSWTSGRTLTVPYEVMFAERIEIFTASRRALGGAIGLAVLSAFCVIGDAEPYAWLFWLVFAALAGLYYVTSRRDQIGFVGEAGRVLFLRDRPSKQSLDEFLAAALDRAREHVRARVLPLEHSGDAHVDRLRAMWLRDKGIISEVEYAAFSGMGVGAADAPERLTN